MTNLVVPQNIHKMHITLMITSCSLKICFKFETNRPNLKRYVQVNCIIEIRVTLVLWDGHSRARLLLISKVHSSAGLFL